jgi:hypothetical protein
MKQWMLLSVVLSWTYPYEQCWWPAVTTDPYSGKEVTIEKADCDHYFIERHETFSSWKEATDFVRKAPKEATNFRYTVKK